MRISPTAFPRALRQGKHRADPARRPIDKDVGIHKLHGLHHPRLPRLPTSRSGAATAHRQRIADGNEIQVPRSTAPSRRRSGRSWWIAHLGKVAYLRVWTWLAAEQDPDRRRAYREDRAHRRPARPARQGDEGRAPPPARATSSAWPSSTTSRSATPSPTATSTGTYKSRFPTPVPQGHARHRGEESQRRRAQARPGAPQARRRRRRPSSPSAKRPPARWSCAG